LSTTCSSSLVIGRWVVFTVVGPRKIVGHV
jgi:hypothetical protein